MRWHEEGWVTSKLTDMVFNADDTHTETLTNTITQVHVIATVGIADIAVTTGKTFTVIGVQANFTQQLVKPVIKHILMFIPTEGGLRSVL